MKANSSFHHVFNKTEMDTLPPEVFLHLVEYLDPIDIAALQSVSRRLYNLARDNVFWKLQCFTHSNYMNSIRRRKELLTSLKTPSSTPLAGQLSKSPNNLKTLMQSRMPRPEYSHEYLRILANWDPSCPSEKVDWYHEYIARNAPISLSWLEQPLSKTNSEKVYLEVKGMGILCDRDESKQSNHRGDWVVGPVEDGSVCLWDIRDLSSRRREKRGTIAARSREFLLSSDLSRGNWNIKHSNMAHTVVTECVSVDSRTKRAYFVAGNGLIEIDLETLSKIRHEVLPFAITALSEAKYPVPLTVGTTQSLHLFDTRAKFQTFNRDSDFERVDLCCSTHSSLKCVGQHLFLDNVNLRPYSAYAHLQGPGPLSVLHVPSFGIDDSDIYLAGRFPSILIYDRRKFPSLSWTIHSGARLSSMDWLPLTIVSEERDLARYGQLSIHQAEKTKTRIGRTLIACGEYKSKGSLEMYGISPTVDSSKTYFGYQGGSLHYSRKNRQTSSNSKLLAVANHGTRIVVSDGGGNLKWFERDGFTQSRCWNIGKNPVSFSRDVFGIEQASHLGTGSEDIIIKILGTGTCDNQEKNYSLGDLIVWTGEKLGLVNFSRQSRPITLEIEESEGNIETLYAERMRRALVANADEVRWMRDLGVAYHS